MDTLINQEASESDFLVGMIKKKKYRKRWVKNVKKLPDHPFNNGIHMDTHHLISAEAVTISEMGEILVKKGYDINLLSNLVGFPATLPGACQLHCQLHRGDHTYNRPAEKPYHDYVSNLLTKASLKKKIKACYGKTKATESESEIHKLLDPVSRKVLKKINKVEKGQFFSLPLTKIAHYFVPDGPGCACQFEVNDAEKHHGTLCSNARLHYRDNDRDGKDKRYQSSRVPWNTKTITFKSTRWTPEVGK